MCQNLGPGVNMLNMVGWKLWPISKLLCQLIMEQKTHEIVSDKEILNVPKHDQQYVNGWVP